MYSVKCPRSPPTYEDTPFDAFDDVNANVNVKSIAPEPASLHVWLLGLVPLVCRMRLASDRKLCFNSEAKLMGRREVGPYFRLRCLDIPLLAVVASRNSLPDQALIPWRICSRYRTVVPWQIYLLNAIKSRVSIHCEWIGSRCEHSFTGSYARWYGDPIAAAQGRARGNLHHLYKPTLPAGGNLPSSFSAETGRSRGSRSRRSARTECNQRHPETHL